mgnify:CR=1 FL=1
MVDSDKPILTIHGFGSTAKQFLDHFSIPQYKLSIIDLYSMAGHESLELFNFDQEIEKLKRKIERNNYKLIIAYSIGAYLALRALLQSKCKVKTVLIDPICWPRKEFLRKEALLTYFLYFPLFQDMFNLILDSKFKQLKLGRDIYYQIGQFKLKRNLNEIKQFSKTFLKAPSLIDLIKQKEIQAQKILSPLLIIASNYTKKTSSKLASLLKADFYYFDCSHSFKGYITEIKQVIEQWFNQISENRYKNN